MKFGKRTAFFRSFKAIQPNVRPFTKHENDTHREDAEKNTLRMKRISMHNRRMQYTEKEAMIELLDVYAERKKSNQFVRNSTYIHYFLFYSLIAYWCMSGYARLCA